MTGLVLILAAAAALALSGAPALFGARRARAGQRLAAGLMVLGSATGLVGVARALAAPAPPALALAWGLPAGRFAVALDPLGAVFLLPVFVVPALASVYALYGVGDYGGTAGDARSIGVLLRLHLD